MTTTCESCGDRPATMRKLAHGEDRPIALMCWRCANRDSDPVATRSARDPVAFGIAPRWFFRPIEGMTTGPNDLGGCDVCRNVWEPENGRCAYCGVSERSAAIAKARGA